MLCYGITPEDHEWLQANRGDVELCAAYMYERDIACALAHPYYHVGAPLTRAPPPPPGAAVRRLGGAQRRAGARAQPPGGDVRGDARRRRHRRLRRPRRRGHRAHVDADAAWRARPQQFLAHVRAGRVVAGGKQGSAAKWAHAAIALAARALGRRSGGAQACDAPDPAAVMRMAGRLLSEGDARHGAGDGGASVLARRRAQPAARVAGRGRARPPRRGGADRLHAGRRLQPLRPLPPGLPRARAQAARGVEQALARRAASATWRAPRRGCSRAAPRRSRTRRRRPSWPTSAPSSTRAARTARRRAWRSSPTASAARTASRAPSRRSARAASRALRSRSSAPTRRSTGGWRRSPSSRCPTTRACASACRACRRPCRRSPTAAST